MPYCQWKRAALSVNTPSRAAAQTHYVSSLLSEETTNNIPHEQTAPLCGRFFFFFLTDVDSVMYIVKGAAQTHFSPRTK